MSEDKNRRSGQFSRQYQPTDAQRAKGVHKAMVHVYRRRVFGLADLLETDYTKTRFNYKLWVDRSTWEGRSDLTCGTTACALGWATTMPSLRRLGLRLTPTGAVVLDGGKHYASECEEISRLVFGFTREAAGYAFWPFDVIINDSFADAGIPKLPGSASPTDVAGMLRKLATHLFGQVGKNSRTA